MIPPNLFDPTAITPATADAFLAIIFAGGTSGERLDPQVLPIAVGMPVNLGDEVMFVLIDESVGYYPGGVDTKASVEIQISDDADNASCYDLGGCCVVAVFKEIDEARKWAHTIEDIVEADLPFPISAHPEAGRASPEA